MPTIEERVAVLEHLTDDLSGRAPLGIAMTAQVFGELREIRTNVSHLANEQTAMREDMNTIREDVNGLREDLNALRTDFTTMRADINVQLDSLHRAVASIAHHITGQDPADA